MKRLISCIFSCALILNFAMAKNNTAPQRPDFDYPETVAKNADEKLSAALTAGNGADVVRYLVQSSLAKSMITTENARSLIERVDSVARCEQSPQYRAMLLYFEAMMLNQYHNRNSYAISQRLSAPGTTNIDEWSSLQFEQRITELAAEATAAPSALAAMGIGELGDLITCNEYSLLAYPTLLDVIAWNVIDMIDSFDTDEAQALTDRLLLNVSSAGTANNAGPLITTLTYGKTPEQQLEVYRRYIDRTDMAYLAIDGIATLSDKEQHEEYSQFLARYPKSVFAGNVKRRLLNLATRVVDVEFAGRFSTTSPISIHCKVKNASDFTVYVLQLPDNVSGAYGYRGDWSKLPIRRYKSVHCEGTVPFADTMRVELPALPCGRYIVYCDPDSKSGPSIYEKLNKTSRYSLQHFIVSDIMLFAASSREGETRVLAVDSRSGKPLSGVRITVKDNGQSFVTDDDGSVLLVKKQLKKIRYSTIDVIASRGADRLTGMSVSFGVNYASSGHSVNIFTDLPVYHPGDTVKWAAVYHSAGSDGSHCLLAGKSLNATFSDSNGEIIDSCKVTTDEFGRASGSFTVPRDRMNGSFSISVADLAVKSIEVSDYKVPTFAIDITSPDFFERGKDAVITGRASTLTGMPVGEARIEARLSLQEWSWWWRIAAPKKIIESLSATTAADGTFAITIPASMLRDEEGSARFSQYVVDVDITSAAGESQSASAAFRTSQFCTIEARGTMCFNAEKEIQLPIDVRCTDNAASVECHYTLTDAAGAVAATGTFASSKPVIAGAQNIKSGEYSLRITGPHDAELTTKCVIFRPTDAMPPVESPLWIPDCENLVDDNNRVTLLLGNSNADSHIYCIAATSKKVLRDGWLTFKPGLHRLSFDIPHDENEFIDITFITVHNGKAYSRNFRHASKYRPNDITIKPVVFRDNLVPGAKERWSLQLVDARGNLVQGAMILEMMDKAITQIAGNDWSLNPHIAHRDVAWSRIISWDTARASFVKNLPANGLNYVNIELPQLHTYGVNIFYPTYRNALRYGVRPRLMMSKAAIDDKLDDNVMADMAAPEVAMEEAEESIVMDTGSAATSMATEEKLRNVEMRTADVATALWRPSLRTDAEGNIFIDFTAPQFCTTWIVQAVAYTADLHTARIVKEVMTTKPVMVRANMPRFVREGDVAQIASSVMNATDSTQHCTAVVEIFNLADNEILASRKVDITLASRETQAVTIDWTVPAGIACVGYRVKAATEHFADGEQHPLAILPSVSPVIETLPFFIDASAKDFEMRLPEFAKNGRITLEYCDNPVWQCVTALPSLAGYDDDDAISSTSIAHSLYALLVARGIATASPEIREAVAYWCAHEADSTLVSNLARNGELKIGTLLASPWLREADRQTLRMHSISRLFDDAESSARLAKLTKRLAEMQMTDGGFTWVTYRNCSSSLFATHTILQLLGEVRQLGYLPADSELNNMLRRALAYYDAEQLRIFNEHKLNSDYASLSDYVYTRSLYRDVDILPDMKPLHSKALAAMRTGWKGLALPAKAYFAVALHRNGDKVTPAKILSSLREFAITKPATGMYWDNLRIGWDCFYSNTALTTTMLSAFAEIEPQSPDIDLIRKWVLIDKQANDWGGSSMASAAINAILSSGSKWLGKQEPARITVAGNEIATGDAESFLGYVKRSLTVGEASQAVMHIAREGNSPAWGALYCQYAAPMTAVKAAKVDELQISKEICIARGNELVKADEVSVGDRLQVRFVIKNSRDLQYVTLHDERAACCEPVEQLSGYRHLDGTGFYQEVKNDATRLFFNYLPKGTHVITYDVHATATGAYNVGVASIQSQYAPQIAAHSAGATITVK